MIWEGLSPPYRSIVADPPWPLRWDGRAGGRRSNQTHLYSTMTLEDIAALPVSELAEDDAHLYLWTLPRFNRDGSADRIAKAWGFTFVGEIVWAKANFGMGAFPRSQHELLLVYRRGALAFQRRDVGSVQHWPLVYSSNGGKTHSAKPHAALDLVESASPGPYVELFVRQQRFGWDSWGWGYEQAEVSQ